MIMRFPSSFLIFLVTTIRVEGTSQFIEVSRSWKEFIVDGVYENKGKVYRKTDGTTDGDLYLLREKGYWQIRYGIDISDLETWYKATLKTASIPKTKWELVVENDESEVSKGSLAAGLLVNEIDISINKTTLFGNQTIKLANAILCNGVTSGTRLFIPTDGSDPRHCDQWGHCENAIDERSFSSFFS